jgi:hypothetical protein
VHHLKDNANVGKANEPADPAAKKPYKTPSFRFEAVFEVSALSCGKLNDTESNCSVRKFS